MYRYFSVYFIVGPRANQRLYPNLALYKCRALVSPGRVEGFKSTATSRSLGNRGYTHLERQDEVGVGVGDAVVGEEGSHQLVEGDVGRMVREAAVGEEGDADRPHNAHLLRATAQQMTPTHGSLRPY